MYQTFDGSLYVCNNLTRLLSTVCLSLPSPAGPVPRSSSDPRLECSRRSRPNSVERPRNHVLRDEPAGPSRSAGDDRRKSPSTDLLSADIRGILDDLQLEEGIRRAAASSSRVRSSTRASRSASPAKTTKRTDPLEQPAPKKRHYDAEAVRLYIAQKQEERKKRQAEERRAQREEEENRNKRLQELYRRQRAGAAKGPVAPEAPIKKRLQETYTKLLMEQSQLRGEINSADITNMSQQVNLFCTEFLQLVECYVTLSTNIISNILKY